ncbi:MAG TPA: [FeFe] hydrogenase H-cluster radical SAM maturase HydE [Thermoleophilia bacterium]|nr:[FeFe] hydrogenase H-cluster radical SAM maturase HydE [Thermoleophilia bacterium]
MSAAPPYQGLSRTGILTWLREEDPVRLGALWVAADETRRHHVGDEVHLRGLIEISNFCARSCGYCGLRAQNSEIERYRMSADEILGCARDAQAWGWGTVVLQSGEDYGLTTQWIADVVGRIKAETSLAVTLSFGERPNGDLAAWREAGADRYLLRFETSDEELYKLIHPDLPGRVSDRMAMLSTLQRLGYEAGSGIMVGIPGQTYDSVADDIDLFRGLDLDMIGVGPYISHPLTPLGDLSWAREIPPGEQIPGDELTVYKVVALARLVCPEANIPSTTALATINKTDGREQGLQRGANIVMPNLTPPEYREKYEIYPDKACVNETAEMCRGCLTGRVESIGRVIGSGPGGRRRGAS